MRTVVIGSGSWGTALAQVLQDNHQEVMVYGVAENEVNDINENHKNSKYFGDVELNPELKYISSRIKLYGISNDIGTKISDNKYEVIEGHMYIIEHKNVKEVGEFDRCC